MTARPTRPPGSSSPGRAWAGHAVRRGRRRHRQDHPARRPHRQPRASTRACALADIAAITFTEAAAAELSDRIRVTFEQRAGGQHRRRRGPGPLPSGHRRRRPGRHLHPAQLRQPACSASTPWTPASRPASGSSTRSAPQLAHEERWERFVDGALRRSRPRGAAGAGGAGSTCALEPRYRGHATMKGVAVRAGPELGPARRRRRRRVHGPLPPLDFGPFDRAVGGGRGARRRWSAPTHDDNFYRHLLGTVLPDGAWRCVAIDRPRPQVPGAAPPEATGAPDGAATDGPWARRDRRPPRASIDRRSTTPRPPS